MYGLNDGDLAQRLRSAIEFGLLKIASADHRLDVAGGVIERQQRALYARLLFQRNARGGAIQVVDFDVDQIARLKICSGEVCRVHLISSGPSRAS